MNRIEILQKVSAGEISVDEAERLLKNTEETPVSEAATEETPQAEASAAPRTEDEAAPKTKNGRPHWLKIRVGHKDMSRDYVKINIPLGLVQAGVIFGSHFVGGKRAEAWNEFLASVERGEVGTIVEVEDNAAGEHVHIFVE